MEIVIEVEKLFSKINAKALPNQPLKIKNFGVCDILRTCISSDYLTLIKYLFKCLSVSPESWITCYSWMFDIFEPTKNLENLTKIWSVSKTWNVKQVSQSNLWLSYVLICKFQGIQVKNLFKNDFFFKQHRTKIVVCKPRFTHGHVIFNHYLDQNLQFDANRINLNLPIEVQRAS